MAKWVCPICQKEFDNADKFLTHYETGHLWPAQWSKDEELLKELTEREFYCQFCGKSFNSYDEFKSHLLTQHKYDMYKEITDKYGLEAPARPGIVEKPSEESKEEDINKKIEEYKVVLKLPSGEMIYANNEIEAISLLMQHFGAHNVKPREFVLAMIPTLEEDLKIKVSPKVSYNKFIRLMEQAGYIKIIKLEKEE